MNKNRLEAFSDGVLAIIITIMVLEIKTPLGTDWVALKPLIPVFISYILSFIFIGIYWVNHHHLLHALKHVSAGVIWANLKLLFWLSLVPFATAWMGENHFAPNTVAVYGGVMLISGVAFTVLQKIAEPHMHDSDELKRAFCYLRIKGVASMVGYLIAIPLAYIYPAGSGILFFIIAAVWFIPKHVERALNKRLEDS